MAYRWHPKYSTTDAENPEAWATADCCGFIWPRSQLRWQFGYQGTSTLQNKGFLVCPNHYDPPNPQFTPVILSPDPPPLPNIRPENYVLDETNWLTTQDGDIITTQDGDDFITQIPNPADNADTASLVASLNYPSGSIAVYLDLLNAGTPVLSLVTGSSTRIDLSSVLSVQSGNIAINTSTLVIAASSLGQTNLTHVAIYAASSGGSALATATVSVSVPSVIVGAAVSFPATALSLNLN